MYESSAPAATMTHRTYGRDRVFYLKGRFDFTNARGFETLLQGRMAGGAVLSFERVTFLDCSAIGALVRLQRAARGKLVIIATPTLPVARIFGILRAATYLRIAPDRETAARVMREL